MNRKARITLKASFLLALTLILLLLTIVSASETGNLTDNETTNNTVDINATIETNNTETNSTGTNETEEFSLVIRNRNKENIGHSTIVENEDGSFDIDLSSADLMEFSATGSSPKTQVSIKGLRSNRKIKAKIDKLEDNKIKTDVFAIEEVDIESATIKLPKKGFVNTILVCNDFDIDDFECNNWDETDIEFTDKGDFIEFHVTHFSAYAGGEIIAINALHLDETYNFISNIYNDVETKDNAWSEPIYENEIVRVTLEEELNNGNYIDVFVRSNNTIAYFEIYEAGTNNLVGESAITSQPELQYMKVDQLTEPTDTFDFKVIKLVEDPSECLAVCEDCEEECNSPTYNSEREVFLEFDFIHDDYVNSTHADGLIVYAESTINAPRYRTWNNSYDFGAELVDMTDIGGDTAWVVTKGNHERNELIVGTENDQQQIHIRTYVDCSWGNLLQISAGVPNSAFRAFDIEYEGLSGDALIVYENSGANTDAIFAYRIWNGSGYSAEQTFTTTLTTNAFSWVELVPKTGADDIMALVHNGAGDLFAVPWNGTDFDSAKQQILSEASSSSSELHFSFGWEELSKGGLVAYGEGSDLVYRSYSNTPPYWSTEATIALGNGLDSSRMCSDPTTDYVGLIWQDAGNDVSVRVWDGTQLLASPPTEETTTEPNGANNANIDCAWYNSSHAMFGFVDNNGLQVDYVTFTKANTWSAAALTSASTSGNFGSNDIKGLRFVPHPTSEEIMMIALDINEDLTAIRWNGSAFNTITASPLEATTEATNAAQEGASFDWYRFDPVPTVNTPAPTAGSSYDPLATVNISVNITDNIAVDTVLANITLPNGTIEQVILVDDDGDNIYNYSFSTTDLIGTYDVVIIANDSSVYQNVNVNETTYFVTGETSSPNVTGFIPSNNSLFNIEDTIQLGINVTDDYEVYDVYVNITLPDLTTSQVVLSNSTSESYKFNNSYAITAQIGVYTLLFFGNDSSNNINSSESITFNVSDSSTPNVTDPSPSNNSVFEIGSTIEIAVNISDVVGVNLTYVNVSLPNGTVTELNLTSTLLDKYNTSYTIPLLPGAYNITYFANDTSNNINDTEIVFFTVTDSTLPNVSITSPPISSTYNQEDSVLISATAVDNVNVSFMYVNVTLPNSDVVEANMTDEDVDSSFNVTFTNTSQTGTYTILYFANDTSNNINSSETRTFTVQDSGSPLITLISPDDTYHSAITEINFSCNATENTGLDNISLYHNISGSFILNQSTDLTGFFNASNFTVSSIPDGEYIWNCDAYDTGANGGFSVANRTFYVDTLAPAVYNIAPVADTSFNISDVIEISINASELYVNTSYVNLTYPNGTVEQISLTDSNSDGFYNNSFTIPSTVGDYTLLFFVNDSAGNINSSTTSNFTVSDLVLPNLTLLGCSPESINFSQTLQCNASITDSIEVGTAIANITYPNGTVEQQVVANISENYHFNFSNSSLVGEYTLFWWVNDSSGNINSTITYFNVTDLIVPNIVLTSPGNYTNFSSSVSFIFNASDNYYSALNCSLTIDGSEDQSNEEVVNQSLTTFTKSNLAHGNHTWNISCTDNSSNFNNTETRLFTIDLQDPTFNSLNYTPSTVAALDPNVNISIFANITDNNTAVNTVIFQYKNSTATNYTNVTAELGSDGIYNASFNATAEDTYTLRLWAKDSVGNYNVSNTVDVSVSNDNTWSISPTSFTAVNSNASKNVTIGNLTINNTGDVPAFFNITSDSSTTIYNNSENFILNAGGSKTFNINDTAPAGGIKTIVLNVSTNNSPSLRTSTATIIVAPGEPVLISTFTVPSDDTLTVTQGDTGTTFIGKVSNIGEGNASNVTLYFNIPDDWTITLGTVNVSVGELEVGDESEHTLEVTIPSNATLGTEVVILNVTGFNASGAEINFNNRSFSDNVSVTINSVATLGTSSSTTSASASSGGGSTGGGGGGGSVSRTDLTRIDEGNEILISEEFAEVVRGLTNSFPVTITNIYANSRLEDISLVADGYLDQYLTIFPNKINYLNPGESSEFIVEITSPSYMDFAERSLSFTITGKIVGEREVKLNDGSSMKVLTKKNLLETRLVKLFIQEHSREEVLERLEEAKLALVDLEAFDISKTLALYESAEVALEDHNYNLAMELAGAIIKGRDDAVEANRLIRETEWNIALGREKGINLDESDRLLQLAIAAFAREDFETALARIKDAQLTYLLLSKGRLNILWILKTYWWAILTIFLISGVVGKAVQKKFALKIISGKITDLNNEETTINRLMRQLQTKFFKKKGSPTEYHKQMFNYEKRLSEIRTERNKLRKKRTGIIRLGDEIKLLEKEKSEVVEKIKALQFSYYQDFSIPKKKYGRRVNEFRIRVVEIERTIALLEAKLAKKTKLTELKDTIRNKEGRFARLHKEIKRRFVKKGVNEFKKVIGGAISVKDVIVKNIKVIPKLAVVDVKDGIVKTVKIIPKLDVVDVKDGIVKSVKVLTKPKNLKHPFKGLNKLIKSGKEKFSNLYNKKVDLWPKERRKLNLKKHAKVIKHKTKNSLSKAKHKFKRTVSAEQEIRNAILAAQGKPQISDFGLKTRLKIKAEHDKILSAINKAKIRSRAAKHPKKVVMVKNLKHLFNLREPVMFKGYGLKAKKILSELKARNVIIKKNKENIINGLREVYKNVQNN